MLGEVICVHHDLPEEAGVEAALLPALRTYGGEGGLKGAVEALGVPVTDVAVEDQGAALDSDTRNEYAALLKYRRRQTGRLQPLRLDMQVCLQAETVFFDLRSAQFLELIQATGSMLNACQCMHMSYSKGWTMINEMERQLGWPVLIRNQRGSGGDVQVKFQYLAGGDLAALEWAKQERARLLPAGRVFIFGGGHVAQALVPALAAVDFRCVVLEDREDFCRPELFPGVEETRLIQNDDPAAYQDITAEDCVAVMTRGHKDDLTVQAHVLKTPAKYIGVIGSRKKTAAVFARLKEMGYADADLARITTPIGLDIKAETPAEIAVSIAAQLIQERAGG